MGLRFIAAGRTDVGLIREHNEDSFALLDKHGLFLVADGMGGHLAGDVASKLATETVSTFFDSTVKEDATWPFHYDPALSVEENRLITGIKMANRTIYEASVRNPEQRGMGTTVVGALVSPTQRKVYIGHVGDSRCYRVRGQSIVQLTQDHSLINEYLRAMPDLSEAQRIDLPKNVITRALGMSDVVMVDLYADDARPGDVYVLCSDGLSGMLTDPEILGVVRGHGAPEAISGALVAMANEHGGEDNVTAVVIAIEGGGEKKPGRPRVATADTAPVRLPEAVPPTDPPPSAIAAHDEAQRETVPAPPPPTTPIPTPKPDASE